MLGMGAEFVSREAVCTRGLTLAEVDVDAGSKQRHPASEDHEPAPLSQCGPRPQQMTDRPPISAYRAKELLRPRIRV